MWIHRNSKNILENQQYPKNKITRFMCVFVRDFQFSESAHKKLRVFLRANSAQNKKTHKKSTKWGVFSRQNSRLIH